ncbi:MAG: hypothetical protein ACUVXJ_15095 [Phycisphaerae bacterium]
MCHGNYAANVEPRFNWQGSMMALASLELMKTVTVPVSILDARADLDRDGDVDENDMVLFETCASGPGIAHSGTAECERVDFDADNDVDQSDFSIEQVCFSGANVLADPACSN